jgi:hypothetical protein
MTKNEKISIALLVPTVLVLAELTLHLLASWGAP